LGLQAILAIWTRQCLALSFADNINRHHEESMKLKALNLILLEIFYEKTDIMEEIGANA